VNLSGDDMVRADLTRANLSHSNLSDSDLEDAALVFTNLTDSNLNGADLGGATIASKRESSGSPRRIPTEDSTNGVFVESLEEHIRPMEWVSMKVL
jgi:hypothetical protein